MGEHPKFPRYQLSSHNRKKLGSASLLELCMCEVSWTPSTQKAQSAQLIPCAWTALMSQKREHASVLDSGVSETLKPCLLPSPRPLPASN